MSTIENVNKAPARTGGESGGGGITTWWDTSRTFLTEVRNEMKRVTWPSQKEVYATTVVVIVTWGLDLALSAAVNWVFRQFGAA